MEERPMTGRASIMPWRKDDDDSRPDSKIERPKTGLSRPQTRHERPVSRRGAENNLTRATSAMRTSTPSRTGMARPPSASAHSQRGNTANPRLNTMATTVAMSRLNTGLPTNHMPTGMMDRPITQHGVAGVRPGTTRGLPMTRQIQDKRYYEGLLQLKIRELTQEMSIMSKEIDEQKKERATFVHYDNRAKELAAELTELQGRLADYNIVIDKVASNVDKDMMEQEIKELKSANDVTAAEIDRLYEQRKHMEQQLRDMEESIESEQMNTERIVESMDSVEREKYDKAVVERNELEGKIGEMQKEIDLLSADKMHLEEQIALSQVKQEAVKLRIKITEAEQKQKKLEEEQKNKLSPEEEREKLLARVKQDNMDIVAAERRIADAEKKIAEAEQELEQLESDLDGNNVEKHAKFNELKKREEAIDEFMPTFEQTKEEEVKKLEKLEEMTVERLRQLAYAINNNGQLTTGDEMAILNMSDTANPEDKSYEGLSKEHIRLQQTLMKMENLEKKLNEEFVELNEKIKQRQDELIVLEDLEGLKARGQEKHEELLMKRDELNVRLPEVEKELKGLRDEYNALKGELEKNEIYVQITALEDKLEKLKKNNADIEEYISQSREAMNYELMRVKTFELAEKYNVFLHESTKPIY